MKPCELPDEESIGFQQVKRILDWLVKGKESRLQMFHGETFGWQTKEELAAAEADPGTEKVYRLIDPSLVGNGRGRETYLIQALTTGVDGIPRMPYLGNDEGQWASPEQIATLTRWIDLGMPD